MVIFFTVAGTVALGGFGSKDLIKSCIPVLSRRYWFITCYFVLCILAPFLNRWQSSWKESIFADCFFYCCSSSA